MNRSISLLVCLLMGVAMCGCQTTQNTVQLGECWLHVEAFSPVKDTIATVNINGMNVGTTHINANGVPVFGIKLAPGTYRVRVTAEGFEVYEDMITLLGQGNEAHLRFQMKPIQHSEKK